MEYKKLNICALFIYFKNIPYIFLIPIFFQLIFKQISVAELAILYAFSILISSIAIVIYIHDYFNKGIYTSENKLQIKSGIFIKKERFINIKNICSISIEQNIFNKILGAHKTFFTLHNSDFMLKNPLYLSSKQINIIKKSFLYNKIPYYINKISVKSIIILSLFHYNIIYIIFFVIPTLKKIRTFLSTHLAVEYNNIIIKNINFLGINPIIASIFYSLIIIIFFIFLTQINRFWNLSYKIYNNVLYTKQGLISSAYHIIKLSSIYAISYKYTLFSMFFNSKFMYIHTIKSKSIPNKLLIDVVSINNDNKTNSCLIPTYGKLVCDVRPNKKSFKNYIALPFILIIILSIVYFITPSHEIKNIITPVLFLILLLQFITRIISFKNSQICLYEHLLVISSFDKLSIFQGVIPLKYVKKIYIKQSPFQKLSKKCNVYVYSNSNIQENFKIKHLYLKNVENLVETLENYHI